MAGERVSGRALAAILNVSETAVRKAERAGRIKKGDDGLYEVDLAQSSWGKSTDPARTKVSKAANQDANRSANQFSQGSHPVVRTPEDAKAAVALIARVLKGEGAVEVGEIDFDMARTADTILKAYQRDLAMAQKRKELVPLAHVKQHVDKGFIGIRQVIQRMPSRHVPEMAAALGCDATLLDTLMSKMIATELYVLSAPVVRA